MEISGDVTDAGRTDRRMTRKDRVSQLLTCETLSFATNALFLYSPLLAAEVIFEHFQTSISLFHCLRHMARMGMGKTLIQIFAVHFLINAAAPEIGATRASER